MSPESFVGVRFDIILVCHASTMSCPGLHCVETQSLVGRRGFGGKDDLWEIMCPESYGGVTFDLGPLQG